jgi:NTE family protein
MTATDIQSVFEGGAANGDFLNAGKVDDAIGLCLSGGGFRAMIYHVGVLRRLNQLGLLARLQEIASVSGGSITAGRLARVWGLLEFDPDGRAAKFEELVAAPLIDFASRNLDVKAILLGLLPGRTAADYISAAYDRFLFDGATLQDIPDRPRFTFMCTNLQTGNAWRFAKEYAADYRVGRVDKPTLPLSRVVVASSAFPPFLSPVEIQFEPGSVRPQASADLHRAPFTEKAVLTDGGVYDNLGLERVWRRCRTILVSNAGKATPEIGSPTGRWVGQVFRTLSLVQQQAENSRRRILFGMHNLQQRNVIYWSIDTPLSAYGIPAAESLTDAECVRVAMMRTRLNAFSPAEIELLLKFGYAAADASLRLRGVDGEETGSEGVHRTLAVRGALRRGSVMT